MISLLNLLSVDPKVGQTWRRDSTHLNFTVIIYKVEKDLVFFYMKSEDAFAVTVNRFKSRYVPV